MRGGRAKPKAGFRFSVQKWPVLEFGGASLIKRPCLVTRTESCQDGRKSAGVHLPGPLTPTPGRRETMKDSIPDELQSTTIIFICCAA